MSKFRSNAITARVFVMALPMRTPPAISNVLQACRNDIRLALGCGEGNRDVVAAFPKPESAAVVRKHFRHRFNVRALLAVTPKHDEILLFVHAQKFARNPTVNTSQHHAT